MIKSVIDILLAINIDLPKISNIRATVLMFRYRLFYM